MPKCKGCGGEKSLKINGLCKDCAKYFRGTLCQGCGDVVYTGHPNYEDIYFLNGERLCILCYSKKYKA